MASPVFPHIFLEMIEEDIEWLESKIPEEERNFIYYDHIIETMKYCHRLYEEYGYDESMRTNNA